jgi:hypothetical protein
MRIPLRSLSEVTWGPTRRREPITIGIPLPSGVATAVTDLRIEGPGACGVPIQVRSLDRWPDGSIRWALVDFVADAEEGRPLEYVLQVEPNVPAPLDTGLHVIANSNDVEVSTGRATFRFSVGKAFPFSDVMVGGIRPIDIENSGLRVEPDGHVINLSMSEVIVRDAGPLRAELEVRGAFRSVRASDLEVFAKVEIWANTATTRLDVTVRNRRRARHPSGQWPLGDKGSILLRSVALVLTLSGHVRRVRCAQEVGAKISEMQRPFEIHQESSGGDHWDGPVHLNREGRVPLRFRGYRLRSGSQESLANRASPVVVVDTTAAQIAVALPQFWANFPRTVAMHGSAIEVGLFPGQAADLHELQGGEQKTHSVVVAFAEDTVSDPSLAWSYDPLLFYPPPEWCCGTGVVPYLIPEVEDPSREYLKLVNHALDPIDGFFNKRELADEYGWRNFGDLYADHESAFQPVDRPFVSHYNNQYDAMAGFAIHFLRSGDPRWWRLMEDLARHMRDIDIYHTHGDKAAYNGGLFWHTFHYTDAGTSTHRTYPAGGQASGGPSAEHNYNVGLMFHYFMTGDRASRDAAVGLARWVLDMDDGSLTAFGWLARGSTGHASATGSATYHGPGRGSANSILACLVAHRLTGEEVYMAKADELVRRCIHPKDDLPALNLLDVERRWFYTVFLQTIGVYLDGKRERGEFDETFSYARASLLHYARWMATNERPYLHHPEILEYPTETWAAQDVRKADVFFWAAIHAEGIERDVFTERADFFFQYSVETLGLMPGRRFTRPIVLMLLNGVRYAWLASRGRGLAAPVLLPRPSFQAPVAFEPQRTRALRRAKWLAVIAVVAAFAFVALSFATW